MICEAAPARPSTDARRPHAARVVVELSLPLVQEAVCVLMDQDARFQRVAPPLGAGPVTALIDSPNTAGGRRPLLSSAHLAGYVLLSRQPSSDDVSRDGYGNLARLEAPRDAPWRQVAEALLRVWSVACPSPQAAPRRRRDDWRRLTGVLQTLSLREHEVLRLIAEGLTAPEMARRLHLADSTVENHRTRLLGKLGVRNSIEAARIAYRAGLVAP